MLYQKKKLKQNVKQLILKQVDCLSLIYTIA